MAELEPPNIGTGAYGFLFEEVMEQMLRSLQHSFESEGYVVQIRNEQQIRDTFREQSLNGVDHMMELRRGEEMIIVMFQEKWKLVTNQREVSQFLDCCARIKARMPEFKGQIFRLWVTRTVPTENGAKSLEEGGAYVVQCSTSMTMLALTAGLFFCELLGKRHLAQRMISTSPSLLENPNLPHLEAKTRDLEIKQLPMPMLKGSKVKVNVRKDDTING